MIYLFQNNICVVQDKCYPLSSTMCGNTGPNNSNNSQNMLWIIGAVFGGVVFIAIVIFIVAKMKLHKG